MEGVHLYEFVENVGVAHHIRLHIPNMSRDGNALRILQNERTWQTLGKTNEVSANVAPIIRVVRYPTSVLIILIIRKDKVWYGMKAYDATTTKDNRLK